VLRIAAEGSESSGRLGRREYLASFAESTIKRYLVEDLVPSLAFRGSVSTGFNWLIN